MRIYRGVSIMERDDREKIERPVANDVMWRGSERGVVGLLVTSLLSANADGR